MQAHLGTEVQRADGLSQEVARLRASALSMPRDHKVSCPTTMSVVRLAITFMPPVKQSSTKQEKSVPSQKRAAVTLILASMVILPKRLYWQDICSAAFLMSRVCHVVSSGDVHIRQPLLLDPPR